MSIVRLSILFHLFFSFVGLVHELSALGASPGKLREMGTCELREREREIHRESWHLLNPTLTSLHLAATKLQGGNAGKGQLHFIFHSQFLLSIWKFRQRFDCRISNPIKFNYIHVSLYLPPPPQGPVASNSASPSPLSSSNTPSPLPCDPAFRPPLPVTGTLLARLAPSPARPRHVTAQLSCGAGLKPPRRSRLQASEIFL